MSQTILTTAVCALESPTLQSLRRRRRRRQNMVGLANVGTRRVTLWSGMALREATSRMVSKQSLSDFKIRRLTFCPPGMNLQAPPNHPDPIYAGFRSRPQDRGPPRGQHHRGGKLNPPSTTPYVTPVGGIYAYMHPGMPMGSAGVGPVRTEWEDYWGQGRP